MNDDTDQEIKSSASAIASKLARTLNYGAGIHIITITLHWQVSAAMAEEALRIEAPDMWERYVRLKEQIISDVSSVIGDIAAEEKRAKN